MRRWLGTLGAVAALLGAPAAGFAWKPYSHNTSALEAYNDAVDDGHVTIEGRSYQVAPAVVTALRNWPAYYNAGVIGPDGFPDLTMGQSIIHPEHTGEWLRHVLDSARGAQSDPSFSVAERQQILAFAYGFLTHAAGDMWGHSFINDFARGVFPAVSEILTSSSKAAIAARHIIAEGYVGDATPGYDGYRDDPSGPFAARGPAPPPPFTDISDDSTPGFPYEAPHRFIFEALVDPAAATPSPERGPIIDFFLDLRAGLDDVVPDTPATVREALEAYYEIQAAIDEVLEACDFDELADIVNCPIALAKLGFETIEAFFEQIAAVVEDAAYAVLEAYLSAWRDDIDRGLRNWGRFGLATTKGLFDAQTRRNLQNDDCGGQGSDQTSLLRAQCEAGVGMVDTILDSADPFINDHLLSMIGLPDAVGEIREVLGVIADVLEDILDALLLPLNPVREALAAVKQFVSDLIADAIADVLGIDIRTLQDFLTQPHRFTCVETVELTLPVLGRQTLELFRPGDHDRLDTHIGFPDGDGHHVPAPPLPASCGRLADTAEFQYGQFRAMHNTVTTAKLLLLDGPALNSAFGEALGRQIASYLPGENLMIESFGNVSPGQPWLLSIDSDHAWRQDGLPRFCDEGGDCPGGAEARPVELNGGRGSFPLWESCVLREGFRSVYRDWETPGAVFPDLGDLPSADPANDPEPPASALVRTGTLFYTNGSDDFVAEDHGFVQSAADGPAGFAFAPSQLELRRRIVPDGQPAGAFLPAVQSEAFTLGPPDGRYHIELQSADPCHDFDGIVGLPEEVRRSSFVLDTTAPVISCLTPPFGNEYDSDDLITVDYAISDGALGSGVAASSATVDGYLTLPGVVPTSDGAALDLSLFMPGTRTVAVSSRDQLLHASALACSFALHATADSLQTNVRRAAEQGLLRNQGTERSLLAKLENAARQHERGAHHVEHNVLEAFVHELQAQSGKGVDTALASRLIVFARDIVALGR